MQRTWRIPAVLDLDVMHNVVQDLYITMVAQQHGNAGATALTKLLVIIRGIYRHIDPEALAHPIVVFKAINDSARPIPEGDAIIVRALELLVNETQGPLTLQLLDNGHLLLWRRGDIAAEALASDAVVYKYESRSETFFARSEHRLVPKLHSAHASNFAVPTFGTLRSALDYYKTRLARLSSCEILTQAWYDENRLYFKAKPEATMRRSLTQFLYSTLRGAEVRPEQIVDETHPVDIKVTWVLTNRLALIEIKWLGDSKDPKGEDATGYTAVRARSGAKQLADYLDDNRQFAPQHVTRGYLVIFDARRRGLNQATKTIDRANGLYYASVEIKFDPEYHKTRSDFEEPIRMFVEPRCA
jgi:hypothetical protein